MFLCQSLLGAVHRNRRKVAIQVPSRKWFEVNESAKQLAVTATVTTILLDGRILVGLLKLELQFLFLLF